MQTHGVPGFPDPSANGTFQVRFGPGSAVNPSSPVFQRASTECQKYQPGGGPPSPAQQAEMMAQALKFSECMRAHGVTDFPDPQSGPGGGIRIQIRRSPNSDLNPYNPKFQAAQQACGSLLPGKPVRANGPGPAPVVGAQVGSGGQAGGGNAPPAT